MNAQTNERVVVAALPIAANGAVLLNKDNYFVYNHAMKTGLKFQIKSVKASDDRRDITAGKIYDLHVPPTQNVFFVIDDKEEKNPLSISHLADEQWELLIPEGFPTFDELKYRMGNEEAIEMTKAYKELTNTHKFSPGEMLKQKAGLAMIDPRTTGNVFVFHEYLPEKEIFPIDQTRVNGEYFDCIVLTPNTQGHVGPTFTKACSYRMEPYGDAE